MILHYKRYGNEDQPTICILHGLFGTLDNWHNVARTLSNDFQVISVDLRNHGQSDHSAVMNYTLMAADVDETLEHLKITSCHFIGHSMGGKVLMKLAEDHPHRVEKMVVVDIAPKKYTAGHDKLFDAMLSIDLSIYKTRKEIEEFVTPLIPDKSVRLFLLKNIQRGDQGGYSWRMNLPVIHDNYLDIIDKLSPSWPIDNQVLFVKGEQSNYIQVSDESVIQEYFPSATFTTIPGAGHWVHADNPNEFVERVLEFLA